jgi:hypothetical protein
VIDEGVKGEKSKKKGEGDMLCDDLIPYDLFLYLKSSLGLFFFGFGIWTLFGKTH